jgi:hypothetical protein
MSAEEKIQLNPVEFYTQLALRKPVTEKEIKREEEEVKRQEKKYWESRDKPLNPKSRAYYLKEATKKKLILLARYLVEHDTPVTTELFDLIDTTDKGVRVRFLALYSQKASDDVIDTLLLPEDAQLANFIFLRVIVKPGTKEQQSSLKEKAADNMKWVIELDNRTFLKFFLPALIRQESYKFFASAVKKEKKNAIIEFVALDPTHPEQFIADEVRKEKLYQEVSPYIENMRKALQGTPYEKVIINVSMKYNPKTYYLWQNLEKEMKRNPVELAINLHLNPCIPGSQCREGLENAVAVIFTSGTEAYSKPILESNQLRKGIQCQSGVSPSKRKSPQAAKERKGEEKEFKWCRCSSTDEKECESVNEKNSNLDDIKQFSDFVVMPLVENGKLHWFTIHEIAFLLEEKKNPYTGSTLKSDFLRILEAKRDSLKKLNVNPEKILPLETVLENLIQKEKVSFELGPEVTVGMQLGDLLTEKGETAILKEEFDQYPDDRKDPLPLQFLKSQILEQLEGLKLLEMRSKSRKQSVINKITGSIASIRGAVSRDDLYEKLIDFLKENPDAKKGFVFIFHEIFARAKTRNFRTEGFGAGGFGAGGFGAGGFGGRFGEGFQLGYD